MSELSKSIEKETKTERALRLGRNINALGAVALAGIAAVIPGPNVIIASWAGINAAQAGGFEYFRRKTKEKQKKKKKKKEAK